MGQTCIIDMRPYIDDEAHELSYWTRDSDLAGPSRPSESSSTLALFGGSGIPEFFASLAKGKAPALQQVNDFAARTSQDIVETSALRKFSTSGAITRMTIKPGRNHVETLAFLPKTAKDLTVSLLDPFADNDPLKLVMVNEPKESYKYGHPESLALPKVVKRQRASIAQYDAGQPRRIHSQIPLILSNSPDSTMHTGEILDDVRSVHPSGPSSGSKRRRRALLDSDLDLNMSEFITEESDLSQSQARFSKRRVPATSG